MALLFGGEYWEPKVSVYNETSLAQHETDQTTSCLCPESPLDVEEIKKKLMDYNSNLRYQLVQEFGNRGKKTKSIRRLTKKLGELIPSIVISKLLPYLQSFLVCDACSLVQLIFHHELAKLDHPAREHLTNSADTFQKVMYSHLKCYFDLYCDDTNPEVFFDFIHKVWKCHPHIAFKLKLLCCKGLLENKDFDVLNQLIQNNKEYFLIAQKNLGPDQRYLDFDVMSEYETYLTILLILLCNYVTLRQRANIEILLMLIEQIITSNDCHVHTIFYMGKYFEDFVLLTLKLKQTRLIPSLIKVLLNRPELHDLSLSIIALCNERLLEVDCYKNSMDFIKDNSDYILNVPFFVVDRECYGEQKLSILLLTLLHASVMCEDLTNMNHVLNRLQEFRLSLLQPKYISHSYEYIHFTSSDMSLLSGGFTDLRNKVSKEESESVSYLKLMTALEGNFSACSVISTEKLLKDFNLLIEQMSLYNETGVRNIIKTLCRVNMQPETQDILIQGLAYYIQARCNKQYSILSNLLLDINMTCEKGEFLQKLTIFMGQHLLFVKEDNVNDVENIIYRSFCILRHENKVNKNKDSNIEKYKKYFSFIPTKEAEEEMEKLTHLRRFLVMLMLIILFGGLHKSAQLKKYLWLKYEYEDTILYLLWCSGDVEINPGPTLKKLRPQADSVKKRNWIHDMCTTTLKILKNKVVDSKTDGLWKYEPDNWQELHGDKPFYDPRNKSKSKQFSIKTDEELLNCLLKCCDGKNISLPSNFQRERTAWKSDIALLLELFVTRQEIDTMKMAKDLIIKYANAPEFKNHMKDYDVGISFNQNSTQEESPKGYSDIVRDLAITFCRISKDLPIFEKSDGIWKTQPHDWNPNDLYYSPCNTGKRHEKHQDQTLVDNLLSYCESKSISIPSELQLVANAWKQRDSQEICKHYTIWSSMAVIQHSIKYLEIEGLLEKPHVQQSLKQIGVSLHCEKDPKHFNSESTINTDNEVSKLPNNSLSNNLRGTHSSSSLCSTRDSDIDCSQHPYEAKALTNSHSKKSVIKCSKPNFQNHSSTSGCTIYSKLVPCPDSRGDLQYTNERLDIHDSHKRLYEIKCQEPDFQPSSSTCSTFTKRAKCIKENDDLPSKNGRNQKRKRAISEERSDKRSALQSGNESPASTSSITRTNGKTTPLSICDSDNADQNEDDTDNMEDEEDVQDQSSNRTPVPDNKQDKTSNHLLQYIDTYMTCDDLEKELGEDIDKFMMLDRKMHRKIHLWE